MGVWSSGLGNGLQNQARGFNSRHTLKKKNGGILITGLVDQPFKLEVRVRVPFPLQKIMGRMV